MDRHHPAVTVTGSWKAGRPYMADCLFFRVVPLTETASDFIARRSLEWKRLPAQGPLIDVNHEPPHVYRRDAWTFLAQSTYAEAVAVLRRLTHLETIGIPAVPLTLHAN
jgi:hypothetical protein